MASGSTVVANKAVLEKQIHTRFENTKGLEMEGYGVVYADQRCQPRMVSKLRKETGSVFLQNAVEQRKCPGEEERIDNEIPAEGFPTDKKANDRQYRIGKCRRNAEPVLQQKIQAQNPSLCDICNIMNVIYPKRNYRRP